MTQRPIHSVIFGCAGPTLSDAEGSFFADLNPLGFILFARNIETPEQVRALCADLRQSVGRPDAPILIDQEGGRVQRMGPPHWPAYPPMKPFGEAYFADPQKIEGIVRAQGRLLADDLISLGIDVNCAPVMDVPVPGADGVIGDRAFSDNPLVVTALASALAYGLADRGVVPVIKHLPGHGRATADSHLNLPIIDTALELLRASDFVPFSRADLPPCFAMTAHVVLEAVDRLAPATCSAVVINDILRGEMGFEGLLMSDDLGMKALSGSFAERTERALGAGCDVVLHCSGDMDEMRDVAGAATPLTDLAMSRLQAVSSYRAQPASDYDRDADEVLLADWQAAARAVA